MNTNLSSRSFALFAGAIAIIMVVRWLVSIYKKEMLFMKVKNFLQKHAEGRDMTPIKRSEWTLIQSEAVPVIVKQIDYYLSIYRRIIADEKKLGNKISLGIRRKLAQYKQVILADIEPSIMCMAKLCSNFDSWVALFCHTPEESPYRRVALDKMIEEVKAFEGLLYVEEILEVIGIDHPQELRYAIKKLYIIICELAEDWDIHDRFNRSAIVKLVEAVHQK
jgi:hypothetical protein